MRVERLRVATNAALFHHAMVHAEKSLILVEPSAYMTAKYIVRQVVPTKSPYV